MDRPLVHDVEGEREVESEVAQLRRGDPSALSALLMRYQPFGSSKRHLRSRIVFP